MEREDLRRTQEMPIVERNGGNGWLYLHDPLGVFSHRRVEVGGYEQEGAEDETTRQTEALP